MFNRGMLNFFENEQSGERLETSQTQIWAIENIMRCHLESESVEIFQGAFQKSGEKLKSHLVLSLLPKESELQMMRWSVILT
jgi:CDP-glycerol glycerophosphotransferase (TagB/SpsB family)